MSFKKNVVSYGIWALYLMVVGIVLSFMGMVLGNQNSQIPYLALGLLVLSFGLLFLVYFLAKKIIDSVQVKKMSRGRAALIEGVLVALSLVAGIVLRVVMIGEAGEEAAYYEVAKVTENQTQLQLVQGSVYYYLFLLNGLFRLVGNKWMAGIVLQIVLQLVGILLAYFAVRRLSGRGSAIISLLFLTLAPDSIREGMTYSPKMLYFCLYAVILLIIAEYLWLSTRPGGKVLTWMLAVLCGGLVAFAGYTDIVGFTLAAPLCGLLGLKREQSGMLRWVAQFLLSMSVMAGVFCLLVNLDASMSGSNFERVLTAWYTTYGIKGADYDFFFRESGVETILLMIFMGLGIFSFMRRKNEEVFSPWVVTVIAIVVMRILEIVTPNMNGSYQMFFAMTALAGVALSELFVRDGGRAAENVDIPEAVVEDLDPVKATAPAEKEKPEEVAASTEERRLMGRTASVKEKKKRRRRWGDAPVWETLPKESFEGQPVNTEDSPAEAGVASTKNQTGTVKSQQPPGQEEEAKMQKQSMQSQPPVQEEQQKQVQFIENPMPLPKKHVKKVMEYPFIPDASQMHYDIEVDPNDNYDF